MRTDEKQEKSQRSGWSSTLQNSTPSYSAFDFWVSRAQWRPCPWMLIIFTTRPNWLLKQTSFHKNCFLSYQYQYSPVSPVPGGSRLLSYMLINASSCSYSSNSGSRAIATNQKWTWTWYCLHFVETDLSCKGKWQRSNFPLFLLCTSLSLLYRFNL